LKLRAVPLTNAQIAALRAIASARSPESYVGGSTPLNQHQTRYSFDIDIFNDNQERVAQAADLDAASLSAAGFSIKWIRRLSGIHTLEAVINGEPVRLDWVADSDFRFFPVVPDPLFGFVLHPVDLAANKTMAAATRRELRDIVDLVSIHASILPLGAVVWAAVEKSPGFTPEGLIGEIRRNSLYPREAWEELRSSEPLDPDQTMQRLRAALDEAEAFVLRMPTAKVGRLFIASNKVVQPDPANLEAYTEHFGTRRGHWPSSPEITAAMMDEFKTRPPQ
jgi:hypothetical protein